MKYQSRTYFVDAFQLTAKARRDRSTWPKWLTEAEELEQLKRGGAASVFLEVSGYEKRVGFGDWIVCDMYGALDVMSDEQFDHLYEPAKES